MENNIPSSNVTNVNVESGSVFVIKAGQGAVLVTGNYQLKSDEVLLVTPEANATVSGQGQQVHIHNTQSAVSIVPNATGPVATTLGPQVQINAENAQNANFTESDIANIQRSVMNLQDPSQDIMNPVNSDEQGSQSNQTDDIAAIQQSILAGQDPTQEAEAPAAGEGAGDTANNSFVSIDYNYDAVLTHAGYDTKGFEREYRDEEDERGVLIADGGENLAVEVTEGDLDSGGGYPTESIASVVVEKGTYALDPNSFYIPEESVDSLLGELNSEITSGGEPVVFTYDAETNTFTGMQDGEPVVSFDVDFVALPNGDVTVSITTTVNQPIDHISGDTTGIVSNQGDDIHIEFPVSGMDINGNEIKEPINIEIDVNDGANEQFGTDSGTTINETDDRDLIVDGQVPLDLGSDEIATITFDPNQPSLEGLTSNGEPTEYTVDGNVVIVTDINGEPVLTVEVQTDGSYTVQATGPLDQDADDIINLNLGITATDDDGDTANGTIVINIEDGENAADVSDVVTIAEGDLENPAAGNAYPVHGTSSVTITAIDDNLNPSTLRLSEEGKAQLVSGMGKITIHNGQPIEFTMTTDENGVVTISAVDGDGNPVFDITMTPTMSENGDVTVVTNVNQYQPLDEKEGTGDTTGLITNNGDTISVDLPLEIDDTDGDTSNVDITVNFVDGEDPSFGDNTEIAEITENDGEQTANGSIEFDQGSDYVDQIVFDPSQPSLTGITSNGEATHIDTAALANDPSTLTLLDVDNNPVMSVTIDADGNYTVTQYQSIDQDDSDITNIALNVSGTDDDDDTANGTINIVINDGANATDVSDTIEVIEGDVDTGAVDADGNPVQTYPVEGHGSITIASPSDNLVASSLRLSEAGKAALQNEMSEVTINGGDPVEFSMTTDDNGVITITGVDGEGNPVLDITMTPTMSENGDVTVVTDVNQYQPLDEKEGTGDTTGLITNNGDTISVDLPLEIDDTDGDTSNVDITVNFVDGEDPSFGDNTEIAEITENDGEQTANGSIEFDQGSDYVDQIVFDPSQPSLTGITSNGEATHIDTAALANDPSTLTLLDVDNNPVMSVTIDADGNYTVTQYQPIDQDDSDITNIALNVSGTDDDDDTANGTINIVINDGANAADVSDTIEVIEGDVDTGAVDADGNPVQTYPVEGHGSITIASPSDNLVASSLRLSEAGKAALQNEMSEVTINGGDPVEFSMTTDDNGVITITGVDGEGNPVLDITMTPTMSENGDVTVVTDVNQYQPLDEKEGTGDTTGLITNNGDTISVDLPLEIDDTDGDTSNVDITVNFVDGEDPSFGDNTEIAEITENDGEQTANGSIEFDQGSDYVDQIVFDPNQPSLTGITSNGDATSYSVDDNTLSLVDADGNPVMDVTIDAQGNYTVTQYQPIDQDDSDITNIALNVSGTDDDDDTANGTINIVINDGANAADVSDTIEVIEGDVDTGAVNADGNPVQTYPVEGHGSITIASPSDNLVASSLRLSEAGKAALQNEMSEVTINGGDPVEFSMTTDDNGVITITGVDGEGNPVLDITMTPTMSENGDVTVVTDVNQYQPLDDNNGTGDDTGDMMGLIMNNGDTLSVDLPLEIDDTDGDTSSVDITVNFKDGEDPSFGTDSGATITESDDMQSATGSIEFDQGSDYVDQIVFDPSQPSLTGITSNGEATHIDTAALAKDPSRLTLLDVDNNPVMSVTIDADGNYTVTQYQPIDQDDSDITNIALNVSGTDDDDDTANGTINIVINDGANATDVSDTIEVIEGDVDTGAVDADGKPVQTYPVEGHGSITIASPSDNLVVSSLRLSEAGKAALQNEMSEVTINGGDPVEFSMTTDDNGVITITGVDGEGNPVLDITMTPTMSENGDVTVVTDVNQYQPLDDNNGTGDDTGDMMGLITNNGDTLSVDLPLEIDDTDGDTSSVDITVNFKDGEDPSFGTDNGVIITESDDTQSATGSIEFDQGSDYVDQIVFDPSQPSLNGITSNGDATHIDTVALANDPSTLTLLDVDNNPVMSVTIDVDGNYTVTQYQPIDQDDSEITKIALNVSGTDDDGDTANGTINIVINDGANAEDVSDEVTIEEGDLENPASGNEYPVHGESSKLIPTPSDDLDPSTLQLTDEAKATLFGDGTDQNPGELSEITSGGQPVDFVSVENPDGSFSIVGTVDGVEAITISFEVVQGEDGEFYINTTVDQALPLDNINKDGDTSGYITNDDDVISIDLPLEISDTDGDTSNIDITVNLKDGQDPSFGDNTDIAQINETDDIQTANGSIEFDEGSDQVDEIVFNQEQAEDAFADITSNGEETTVLVDGNTVTLSDLDGNDVLTVAIDENGKYVVTQYQPIDQDDSEITKIALNVSGTDDDGDTAKGTINIVINDGANAEDVSDQVTIEEGDLENPASGNEYPVHGESSKLIPTPSDDLDPSTLQLTDEAKATLFGDGTDQNPGELSEITSGGQPVDFVSVENPDGSFSIVGTVDGVEAITISFEVVQGEDGEFYINTTVDQALPLDNINKDGDTSGYITNDDDVISVDLPLEISDTDGDTSNIDITVNLKDGQDPSFGDNTDIAEINETDDIQTAKGSIEFDEGSDQVDEIVFDPNQPSLTGITSNGEATHIDTAALANDPSTLTLLDVDNNPVMSVTIDADGNYTVTQYQPIDQDDSNITNIALNVTGTDDDGDTANGTINIVINDGDNAADVSDEVTIGEGDLDNPDNSEGSAHPSYPVSGSSSMTIESPSDDLVNTSLTIDETVKEALKAELNSEVTTNGGDKVTFEVSTDPTTGIITITGVDSNDNQVLDITMTPTMGANGDVVVTTNVNQYQPLDNNDGTGDSNGYIANNGDVISVDIPMEISDTDGDTSNIYITVNLEDGQDPSFGDNTDIAEINETDDIQTANGSIEFDQGSDYVDQIVFDPNQPSLTGITSNGEATHIDTAALANDPSTLTLLDVDNNPVMSVTIDADGNYTVTQYQPIDQDDSDITNIALNVSGTDDDGDTANGTINIVINDGGNAEDVSDEVTIEEGDLENPASGNEYPVHGESSKLIPTPSDDLDPSTLQLTDEAKATLFGDGTDQNPGELSEITSGGQPVDFVSVENPDGSFSIVGTVDGVEAITISFEVVQGGDGEFYINTTVDQALPLDDINKDGDTSGYITNDGDVISIDLPLEISDTDGDTSNIDITVNLEDGQDPSFSDDSEAVVITETDFDNVDPETGEVTQTPGESTGKIPSFDMGSDEIASMTFDDPQGDDSGLGNITYDGGKETDYEVDGNTITVTGENDEPILSITVDIDGNYTVTQYEPIDQDAGDVDLNLSVTAVDDDGDSASGSFNIVIVDPEGVDVTDEVNITEGDQESWTEGNAYPVSGSSSVVIDSSSDDLRPETLHIDPEVSTALEAELDGLTSNGQPIDFEITTNSDGTITITGTSGGSDVLTMRMTSTVDADGNATITTDVVQNGPIDHEDGDGDSEGYVTNNGDSISIDVPLVIDDADGTPNNVDITVNIEDGQDPSFGKDTGATLEEGTDGTDSASGDINVDTGSDDVVDVRFGADQSQLDDLTSNGQDTSVVISDDGHTLTIVDADNIPVMEVTIDQNGHYEVEQFQPIDQINEDNDTSDIPINVEVEDADGDVGKGTITIHDTDGDNAQGGGDIDAGMIEGDLTPDSDPGDSEGYPKTAQSGSTHVDAGSDDLDPNTVQVDPTVMDDLITELNTEITTEGGGSVEFSFDPENNTLTGVDANGNPVLDFHLIATPTENGGVDISVDMTQYQPIDHVDGAGDTDGYVHNDGDNITINIPIQIQDTDGDYMDESIDFNGTITDGKDLEIDSADNISVNESDIDKGGDNHAGSTPGQSGESATGTITIDSGSDEVNHYEIDVNAFNEKNSDSEGNSNITSGGTDVILVDNGDGTYSGVLVDDNGNPTDDDVFKISFDNTNGSYTFEVTGAIDQPLDNGNGGQSTNIVIPIHGVDDDGDSSNTIDVNVTVNDDVPTAQDVSGEAIEEGSGLQDLGNIIANEGADGATVTGIKDSNGNVIELKDGDYDTVYIDSDGNISDTGDAAEAYYAVPVTDGGESIGTLYVSENGDIKFEPVDNLDHDGKDYSGDFEFVITDGDGDTDTAEVTVNVTDEGPSWEINGGSYSGHEEDGRTDTTGLDNLDGVPDETPNGIPIEMQLNVGDRDEGETIINPDNPEQSTVVITPPEGGAHGEFMYDGEPLETDADGNFIIPADAFSLVDNGDGTYSYELSGVTFVPDSDFSTVDGNLEFGVQAEVIDNDSEQSGQTINGNFNITVEGVADTPTWDMDNTDLYYETGEDSDNVKLNIDVDLNDNDGSETLEYHLEIKEGEGDIYVDGVKIEPDENGVYTISADDIDKVEVDPADDWSGEMQIDAWGTSTESGDTVDGKETAESDHQTIVIDVTPDADEVSLSTNNNIKVDEDTAIQLSDVITKAHTSVDDDGSESYFVRISGLPEGATVWGVDDEGNPVELEPNADGFYVISFDDIDDTVIMPPPQSNDDFTFTVDGMSVDNADLSDTDLNDEDTWAGQDSTEINVDMHGVVDDPSIIANGDWEVSDDGKTISTTVDEDGTATIDFGFISGEYTNTDGHGAVSEDTDSSEKITFTTLQDIPEGVYFSDADGNPLEPTLVSTNPDLYQFDVDSLNGIQIHTDSNSADDIDIPVRIVVTEDDGASKEFEYDIHINVNPVVDGVGRDENGDLEEYNTTSTGNEDELVKLNWDPTAQFVDNDGSEKVVGLTINGFENYPDGYAIVIGDEVLTPDENGSITLTPEQLAEAQESGLYLSMPEDADSDLHLTTDVTIRDSDTENPDDNYDETTIHGNLDVDVTSVVEEDGDGVNDGGKLVIDDADGNAITDTDGDGIQDVYEDQDPNDEWSNEIHLSVNDVVNGSSGGNSLDWVNDDTSSDEVINKVIITFPDDLPDGFQVEGAVNNGNGSFTITEDQLDDIVIKAPRGFDGDVTIHVSVTVQDQGDDANSESETIIKETDITLHFTDEHDGGGGTYTPPAAGDIDDDATQDQQVDASEDQEGGVNIGELISDGLVISTDDTDGDGVSDLDNDTTSIIINADDLPPGATIGGMEYNEQTGEYVISVTPNADGSITLPPDVILYLPPDYAGDIDIPVKVVETDNESGQSNEGSMNITVNVDPVADAPDVTITGGGDEDSLIELDLSTVIGDQNNGGKDNGGDEEITDVTIKLVDPSQGEFVDANGDVIQPDANGEIHVDPNDPIYFQPAPDFSGTVDVTVTTDVTDTAMVDGEEVSNSGSFEQNVSFDVNAVNDDIEINGEVATDDNPVQVTGDEGTSISFGDFNGNVTDMDGSEEIVSVSITGVPDGFVIEGANNMGGGVWSIPDVISDDGQSFDLSGLSILPPNDFSGDIDLTLKVYTTDDNGDPVEKDVPVNIHVDAKADAVNTDVDASVSGDEDVANGITININAHAVDDENSVTDPASNVQEDAPEQVQVTISNVPDGATFGFPEGSDGEIIQNPDGTVTIVSDGSDLDSIIFYPPEDGNSDNMTVAGEDWDGTLDLAIQGNDNGDTSGPVENVTVDIDVKAENDAAVNTVPDSVPASADGVTTITGLQISDVDASEGKGDFTVELHAGNGSLSLPEGTDTSGLTITESGDGTYTIEGSLDDINAVLDGGIIYTPDDGYSGDDTITMTTTDNGDADGKNQETTESTITITDVVSTESDEPSEQASSYNATYTPTEPAQNLRSHLASATSQVNATSAIPLTALLLGAAVAAEEGDSLQLNHLDGAQIVDADNQPLGTVAEDGSVTLTPDQVAEAYVHQQAESTTTEFTVVTKSADNRVVAEHNVSTASFNTTGLDSQRDDAGQNNSSASSNNAENVQAAAVGDAEHAVEGQNVADLLAANPEMAEQLAENADLLSDDLHAIVDEVSALSQDNIGETVADKVSELQQDVHDATTQDDLANQDLSLADNPFDHENDTDELASNEDSSNYFEQSSQDDETALADDDALNADDSSDDFDSEQDSLYSNDDASDSSIYADDANQDDGFFGDDDDSFDWDHLAANGLDGGLDSDMSGMEMTDDVMMLHSDSDFDVSDLLDQDDQNGNLDMDKLLGEAAPSSAADIGKPEEASADDLASTQHLDQPDVSGMGMDLSGLHDTSSAGHIINDLFDPNSMKPTDG